MRQLQQLLVLVLCQHLVNPGLELCVDLLPLLQVCCMTLHRLQAASKQRHSSSAPQPATDSSHRPFG
jgi:hypothetical protein